MANTRELRRRIRSVKNTAQITKAMQMVAATKMRRAQAQALSGRPYDQTLNYSLSRLTPNIDPEAHPLLGNDHQGKTALLILTTDKSLCGALNTNVFRATLNFVKEKGSVSFYTVGKKGRNFVVKTNRDLVGDFENLEIPTFGQARQIGKLLIDSFLQAELKEVYLIYPHFQSTLRQEPKLIKLLPIDINTIMNDSSVIPENEVSRESIKNKSQRSLDSRFRGNDNVGGEFLFEPNPDELLDFVLVHFVETKIYQALLETKASEYSSRMIAMQNATDNAQELVLDLNLTYNQTRQSAITNELLEITSASAALE